MRQIDEASKTLITFSVDFNLFRNQKKRIAARPA